MSFKKIDRPGELKMFHNGTDWVIAYSVEDAREIVNEQYGPLDESEIDGDGWKELKQYDTFTMMLEHREDFDSDYIPRNARRIYKAEATAKDWIDTNGRGFLASTEW